MLTLTKCSDCGVYHQHECSRCTTWREFTLPTMEELSKEMIRRKVISRKKKSWLSKLLGK